MKKKRKDYLSNLIDETYGSPEELAKHLDLGVEMLFYLEEDTFERRDIQSVASTLKEIINILRQQV